MHVRDGAIRAVATIRAHPTLGFLLEARSYSRVGVLIAEAAHPHLTQARGGEIGEIVAVAVAIVPALLLSPLRVCACSYTCD